MAKQPTEFILASGSPRRRQILADDGWKFRIQTADVAEHEEGLLPQELVEANAHLKAKAVSKVHPKALVLGSDTTVALGNEVLNKPRDGAEARAMLRHLSGKTHYVLTAIVLIHEAGNLDITKTISSRVQFKKLNDGIIEEYLSRVHTLDKAGGYAIQEHGNLIVADYDEPLTNIIGLPMEALREVLIEHGFDKLFRS
jgi:septum formation protein